MSRLLACAFMFGISVAAISGLRAQSTLRIVESYVYKIDNVMKPKNLVQLDVADRAFPRFGIDLSTSFKVLRPPLEVQAPQINSALPFGLELFVEHKPAVCAHDIPGAPLELAFELTRPPTCVAESQ